MPQEITLPDGTIQTVYTQEEVQAAATAKQQETEAKLKGEIDSLNKRLEGMSDKDHNFAALRQQVETAQAKMQEMQTNFAANVQSEAQRVANKIAVDSVVSDSLTKLSGNDPKLMERIQFELNKLKNDSDTPDTVKKKLVDAYRLATADEPNGPDPLAAVISSAGAMARTSSASPDARKASSPEEIEFRKKMGITQEKYLK